VRALGDLGAWVRLHYVYPYPHVDEIIPLMAEGKVLPYLDVPLQHASTGILKAMKRPANAENTLERIHAWREICPEISLRSTFIVGFPGETEDDFELLLSFLKEAQLDRVGCFQYSPVEGATANQLANPVPAEIKAYRFERFMKTQETISQQKLQRKVGQTMIVIVDEIDEDGIAVARSSADAPDIDGLVFIEDGRDLSSGDFAEVTITHASDHDLWGIRKDA